MPTSLQLLLLVVVSVVQIQTKNWEVQNMIDRSTVSNNKKLLRCVYCYRSSAYVPTCGWVMLLSTSIEIKKVQMFQASVNKIDDFTYELRNLGHNKDLTSFNESCYPIRLYGKLKFGNDLPEVVMSFSCVCNSTTSGQCLDVPHLTATSPYQTTTVTALPPTTPATTTKPHHSTTETALPTTTPSTTHSPMTTSNMPETTLIVGHYVSMTTHTTPGTLTPVSTCNATSIRLRKVKGKCYTGSRTMTPTTANDIETCGAICMEHSNCKGVNFMSGTSRCTCVTEEVASESTVLEFISGCEFWELVWK